MKNLLYDIKNHPSVSENASIKYYAQPYPHLIIDNFLKEDIYNKISNKFPEYIDRVRGSVAGVVGENKELFYNANIYSMTEQDCVSGLEFFIDPAYKEYISNLFGIVSNQHTAYSLHFHAGSPEKPSNSGWSHKDLSICSAIDDPSKEIKIISDCDYQDDTYSQPHTKKVARAVAMLYYLNNKEDLTEEDGGGTGVYDSYSSNQAVKTVLPVNNRLFVFEISPKSYHGFVGAKFNRSAIVQWFHTSPGEMLKKHLHKFKEQYESSNKLVFERWKPSMPAWSIEQDPDYIRYFGQRSVDQVLSEK